MSLFGFSSGLPVWYELLFSGGSYLIGMFLLVIAGLAFTQYYRRPRESRWLLAAIGLTLVNSWILWRMATMALMFISQVARLGDINLLNFGMNFIMTLIGVVVNGAVWWCLFIAAFSEPPPPPEAGEAEESLA